MQKWRLPRWVAVLSLGIGGHVAACGVRAPGDGAVWGTAGVTVPQGAQTGSCFEYGPGIGAQETVPPQGVGLSVEPAASQHVINEAAALSRAAVEAAKEGNGQQAVNYLQLAKSKLVGLDLSQLTVEQRTQALNLLDQIDQALTRAAGGH